MHELGRTRARGIPTRATHAERPETCAADPSACGRMALCADTVAGLSDHGQSPRSGSTL